MRSVLAAFALATAVVASAPGASFAQAGNPITEHFRAFQAALAEGDIVRADAEASAALAASEARDGAGGRTAVLALNLALLRIESGRREEARAPAARAYEIVQVRGEESRVDPVLAQLVAAHAALGGGGVEDMGVASLSAALDAADARDDLNEHAFSAATTLGAWFMEHERLGDAESAYQIALNNAGADSLVAHTNLAAARMARAVELLRMEARGERRRALNMEADRLIHLAMYVLNWLVVAEDARGEPTPTQIAYARALAWHSIANFDIPEDRSEEARAESVRQAAEYLAQGGYAPPEALSQRVDRMCSVELTMERSSQLSRFYPQSALDRGIQGVVVLRVLVEEDESISRVDVVASAPEEVFSGAATRLVEMRGLVRRLDERDDCLMSRVGFSTIKFRLAMPR